MSWAEHHTESERLASAAEVLARGGGKAQAQELYAKAAEAEMRALFDLDPKKSKTLGITIVSAVALWYRARNFVAARKLAHHWLAADEELPPFAQDELQSLLQMIWSVTSEETAGVEFVEGDVLVSVKGGQVVFGGAPLDLVVRKVEEVQALFYRTAEFLLGKPHRKRGMPSADVQSVFQPWLFQAPAGSYQFAVRVQKPPQINMFEDQALRVSEVVSTCLAIVRASVEDPDETLKAMIPDPDYQMTFLKLTRNLAPTGDRFSQIDFRDPLQLGSEPVALVAEARKYLNEAIRERKPKSPGAGEGVLQELSGVLRAVHLDEDWLEITAADGIHHRITEIGDVVDDVIGPMINHNVIVEAVRNLRGKLIYRDIEAAD